MSFCRFQCFSFLNARRLFTKVMVVLTLAGILFGCASTNPSYKNYKLVMVSDKTVPDKTVPDKTSLENAASHHKVLPSTLGIFPVSVAGWLDKRHLVWSDGSVVLQRANFAYWGESLPTLMTKTMMQNMQQRLGSDVWISQGPWSRSQKPEVVARFDVQSIAVVDGSLQVSAAWTLENQAGERFVHQSKVYQTAVFKKGSKAAYVQALSHAWGLVATDIFESLSNRKSIK